MSERRTGWLLVAILVGQLILIAVQVPGGGTGTTLIESVVLRLLAPVAALVHAGTERLVGLVQTIRDQRSLVRENRELRQRVEDLRLEVLHLRDVELERDLLGRRVGYPVPPQGRLIAVEVVYADYSSWLRTLLLYIGDQPVAIDEPVLSSRGLVGRVITVTGRYAKAQLITDRAATVGVMIERTRRQGLARGAASGQLEIDYVPLQSDVRPGDRVFTSGIDGVYPRQIPVGTVLTVEPGNELFHHIVVRPTVDFGALNQVYLLRRSPLPETPRKEGSGAGP